MFIRRKSDGVILCQEFTEWSDWYQDYIFNNIPTISGVLYPQPWGVSQEMQDVTCAFANHFPNSTQANYHNLVLQHRRNRTLQFQDRYGDIYDVRVVDALNGEASERWQEVRTKNIRFLKVKLMKLAYRQ